MNERHLVRYAWLLGIVMASGTPLEAQSETSLVRLTEAVEHHEPRLPRVADIISNSDERTISCVSPVGAVAIGAFIGAAAAYALSGAVYDHDVDARPIVFGAVIGGGVGYVLATLSRDHCRSDGKLMEIG